MEPRFPCVNFDDFDAFDPDFGLQSDIDRSLSRFDIEELMLRDSVVRFSDGWT